MNEAALAQVFRDAVKAHPACAPLSAVLQWRVPESKEALALPAVTFSAREVQPIGVGAFCTGIVEVKLEAQSDDETSNETHVARAALLSVALTDTGAIGQAINTADPRLIRLSGYALNGGGRGADGRRWVSTILLRVGFAPVA